MKRTLLACLVLAAGAACLAAQEEGQTNPYAGTSNPPQDDILVTAPPSTLPNAQPLAKPAPGRSLGVAQQNMRYQQSRPSAQGYYAQQPNDDGIVQMTPESSYRDPESNVYQPLQPSSRYNPAPVNRTPSSAYQAAQTDPYYQDAPVNRGQQQGYRSSAPQADPYYQDAAPAPYQPAQNSQRSAQQGTPYQYQSTQPDPYRPAQTTPYQYQSSQTDPYYQQQAPTKMYRPQNLTHAAPAAQNGQYYPPAQQDPYYQSQQGAYQPAGQSDPYYQGGQGNTYGEQQNVYGIYGDGRDQPAQPTLSRRIAPSYDPDGDIVRPSALGAQQLAEGTTIRVSLVGRISSSDAVSGQRFRTRVVFDVMQNGRVLIPANSEIDGRIYDISRGHMGSGGSMHLRPEVVILSDGTRFKLAAQVTGAPGANAHIGTEGTVKAGSRVKRDTVEYGGAMGVGAGTGAYLGGPAGALAGAAIGAGVITAHLLISHPQATLESGTPLQFTLTQRLNLVPSPYGD